MSSQYATSTSTVTVSGTLSNHTGSAIPGIIVQAQTSTVSFNYRSQMTTFAAGGGFPSGLGQAGPPGDLPASLASGATERWTVSFPAAAYYSGFGVYPIEVQAAPAGSSLQATAETFLPFWPGTSSATKIFPLRISWIWPLIDAPQQGACPQTLGTAMALSGSLAANGRLSTLLRTGAPWAAKDNLTWAIDPALLDDANVMTHPYSTGGNSTCTGRTPHKTPSAAATTWLSELRTDTAGKAAFATAYGDADASSLSHNGLDANLRSAYQVGNAVASKILPDTFGAAGSGSGTAGSLAAAWPAGGTADTGVLSSLASDGGINTVVLSSEGLLTSAPYFDNALARAKTGNGTSMSVLLADSGISGILGSASPGDSAAARFAITQDFLAQTAMILAQATCCQRYLVVAPPAGWDPSAAEAADLLKLTKNAPWLRATGLRTLASQAARVAVRKLPRQVSKAEFSAAYIAHIESLNANLSLYKNLLSRPSPRYLSSLDAAAAAAESAAWRGSGSPGGWLALTKLDDFLTEQESRVKILASSKFLLAGTSGTTPVSVTNSLDVPVQVRVVASAPPGSQLRVSFDELRLVQAHRTTTVRIPLTSSAIGTTTMQLELETGNGTLLTGSAKSLSVQVTRFGRTLLVIIVGALGVLVLTAVVQLRRRRRATAGRGGAGGDRPDDKAHSRAHAGGAG